MKEPKSDNLKIERLETKKIKKQLRKGIKITINIDSASLTTLKKLALQTGIPYQRLLNTTLKEGLNKKSSIESRIQKLEQEIKEMKIYECARIL